MCFVFSDLYSLPPPDIYMITYAKKYITMDNLMKNFKVISFVTTIKFKKWSITGTPGAHTCPSSIKPLPSLLPRGNDDPLVIITYLPLYTVVLLVYAALNNIVFPVSQV